MAGFDLYQIFISELNIKLSLKALEPPIIHL